MTPEHYYNYRQKYGQRAADTRLSADRRIERERSEQDIVNRKARGMGCNE